MAIPSNRWVKSYGERAMEHPLFRGNPMSYGVWMMMISMAAWRETKFDVKGKTITLQRGQLCASERHLAEVFGTSRSWITRLLARLKTEQMIELSTEPGRNIITICNYSLYQDAPDNSEPVIEPSIEPTSNHKYRDIINTVVNNNKPTIANFSENQAPESQPSRYAFEGQIIRLNQKDLDAWKATYHAIPDLIAELHTLDAFYAGLPEGERKNWFHRTRQALNKKHQNRLESGSGSGGVAASGPPPGGIDYAEAMRRQQEQDRLDDAERLRVLSQDSGAGQDDEPNLLSLAKRAFA